MNVTSVLHKLIGVVISPLGTSMGLLLLAGLLGAWSYGKGRFALQQASLQDGTHGQAWSARQGFAEPAASRGHLGLTGWPAGGVLSCVAAALVWLLIWATPATSQWLMLSMQDEYPPQKVEDLPPAQAVVLLGGGMVGPDARRPYPDLGKASDRVWHAARIWRTGKAPLLVATGGGDKAVSTLSEAAAMRLFLLDLGVPDSSILLEEASFNTRENAVNTAALLKQRGVNRVLLVTSVLHMNRAVRHFEAVGLQVIPAACDHAVTAGEGWLRWLPSAESLSSSTEAMRAVVGRWAG